MLCYMLLLLPFFFKFYFFKFPVGVLDWAAAVLPEFLAPMWTSRFRWSKEVAIDLWDHQSQGGFGFETNTHVFPSFHLMKSHRCTKRWWFSTLGYQTFYLPEGVRDKMIHCYVFWLPIHLPVLKFHFQSQLLFLVFGMVWNGDSPGFCQEALSAALVYYFSFLFFFSCNFTFIAIAIGIHFF